uniref:DUF4781 domain-containing protein n=1 Tax=Sipha flava TaxID=143950 RepID=A0A2S2QMP5_9HEMI
MDFTDVTEGNVEQGYQRMLKFVRYLEKLQFEYFNGRPEWTTINVSDLKLFMAYSYFGYPKIISDMEEDQNENFKNIKDLFDLYKKEEKESIEDMFKVIEREIIKNCSKIMVGITMVHSICKRNCKDCANINDIFAHVWLLLRIKINESVVYIDICHMRTYKDFNDYVQNNELPSGFMYFPKSGMYEENDYLKAELTPPSRKTESIMSTLDSIGTWVNFGGGAILCAGLFFTVAPSIAITSAVAVASSCVYDTYRQSRSLSRINTHNGSLVSSEAMEHWLNLGISILGAITAPLSAVSRYIETESVYVLRILKFGRSLNSFQKGLYITQATLEIMRFTVKAINKNITMRSVTELRLDLFVVTGRLLPISFVETILQIAVSAVLNFDDVCWRIVTEIAYCVGQRIMRSPTFVMEHAKQFVDKLGKFVSNNLTMDKMLCAWQVYSRLMNAYRELAAALRGPELLRHVVHHLLAVPCDAAAKEALCGHRMKELLDELGVADDRHAVEVCVRLVVGIADGVREKYRDAVAALADRSFTDSDRIDTEFCVQYGLAACTYAEFVLHGIRRVAADGQDEFWRAYRDRPMTVRDQLHVASYRTGEQSLDTFVTAAPPEGPSLSADFCRSVVTAIDPANSARYSNSQHMSLPDDTFVLTDVPVLGSFRIVFFYVDSSAGRSQSLNVSIYNHSAGNIPGLRSK